MNRLHHLVLCNAIAHNYLAERNWWLVKCRRRGEALGPLGWKPLDVTHQGGKLGNCVRGSGCALAGW